MNDCKTQHQLKFFTKIGTFINNISHFQFPTYDRTIPYSQRYFLGYLPNVTFQGSVQQKLRPKAYTSFESSFLGDDPPKIKCLLI